MGKGLAMSEKDDGGPAFPRPDERDGHGNGICQGSYGMSLRDWFAGQALACICPAYGDRHGMDDLVNIATENGRTLHEELAHAAYKIADAMISERTKRSGT